MENVEDKKENDELLKMEEKIQNNPKPKILNESGQKENLEINANQKEITELPQAHPKPKLKTLNRAGSKDNNMNLRYSFQTALSKLSSPETLDNGVKDIKEMFEKNNTNNDLSIYLSLLFDEKKNYNLLSKEALMNIFSLLFTVYNTRLISETNDMKKMLIKIREFIIKQFEEISNSFQIACSQCLISLYHNCFKENTIDIKRKMFMDPFLELFQGKGNLKIHHTTSIYFLEFLSYLKNTNENELILDFGERILQLFLKLKKTNIFYELLGALKMIFSEKENFVLLKNVEEKFISKLLGFLKIEGSKTQNINEYMCKVISCELLSLITKQESLLQISKTLKSEILENLKKNSSNRIIKVQKSALLAYKEWFNLANIQNSKENILEEHHQEIQANEPMVSLDNPLLIPDAAIQDINVNEKKLDIDGKTPITNNNIPEMKKLQQARDNYKLMKVDAKSEKNVPLQFFQRKKLNFVKKKTGLGGGFFPIFPKKNNDKPVSARKDEKKLREFIVKTKKEKKKDEKFVLLNEQQENFKYSKAFNIELPNPNSANLENHLDNNNETLIYKDKDNIIKNDLKPDENIEKENNEIKNENPENIIKNMNENSKVFEKNENNLIYNKENLENQTQDQQKSSEFNKQNDDMFQEEEHLQGDEAMTLMPQIIKPLNSEENIFSIQPPSIKPNLERKAIEPQQKNTIFNLSIKESENISKGSSPNEMLQQIRNRRKSSLFSNIEFAPSLVNINMGNYEQTKENQSKEFHSKELFEENKGIEEVKESAIVEMDEEAYPKSSKKLIKSKQIEANHDLNNSNGKISETSIKNEEDMDINNNISKSNLNEDNIMNQLEQENSDKTSQNLKENIIEKKSYVGKNKLRENTFFEGKEPTIMNSGKDQKIELKVSFEQKSEKPFNNSIKNIKEKNDEQIISKKNIETEEISKALKNVDREIVNMPLENFDQKKFLSEKSGKSLKNLIGKNMNSIKNIRKVNIYNMIDDDNVAKNIEIIQEDNVKNIEIVQESNNKIIENVKNEKINDRKTNMECAINKNIILESQQILDNSKENIFLQKQQNSKKEDFSNKHEKHQEDIQIQSTEELEELLTEIYDNDEISFKNDKIMLEKRDNGITLNDYQLKLDNYLKKSSKNILNDSDTNTQNFPLNFNKELEMISVKKNSVKIKKKIDYDLKNTWKKVSFSLENDDVDQAFSDILDTGDDIYLIRLMNLTGPCINKMSTNTIQMFVERICEILNNQFIDKILIEFLGDSIQVESVIDDLNVEEQNRVLGILEDFKDSFTLKQNANILLDKFKNYLKI